LKGVNFANGIIEVKILSRLLESAPDFARGFIGVAFQKHPSFIVGETKGDIKSGSVALWVDIGREGYFKDLKITNR